MQRDYKCDSHDLNTAFNLNVEDCSECVLGVDSHSVCCFISWRGYMI